MIKELQHWVGYYAATVVCWISSKLDTRLWEDEDVEV